jgi:hypothetical protein
MYIFGGTDRSNASIAVNLNNATLALSKTYTIDASSGAVILALPNTNRTTSVTYTFSY